MLSRVADSLYWMSRYLERVDHVTRLIDVHLTIVPEQSTEAAHRRRSRLVTSLVGEKYPVDAITSDFELAALLTFDEDNPNSIARCIASARENARPVREQINSQMWEQINQMYLYIQNSSMADIWVGEPHQFYHRINQDVYRFQGITDSRVSRDQGWHFIQLGKYIERAAETADALNVDFRDLYRASLAVDAVDQNTYLEWVGLLRGCAAYEAYSKVYTANVQPNSIVEFLILNPEFPYSVRFAINAIQKSLDAIGVATETPKSARVYRLAGRLRATLDYAQVEEIMESGLGSSLLEIQNRCAEIHDIIYQTYIAYTYSDRVAK
ncbi:MAG: alpha-E domain-containing protein [Anaerolineales bacterium]|nr:alpha-E domain-containing protein [Anaerolineales bacterium]